MDYTKRIMYDLECNYVDLSKNNASDIILNCINKKPVPTSQKNNTNETVEGFAADYGYGGVRYIANGDCPVGHKRVGDECHQVCRGCNYIDEKQIERRLYSEESKRKLNNDTFDYLFTNVSWDADEIDISME